MGKKMEKIAPPEDGPSSPIMDFLFIGNHLALDFLNTKPVVSDKPVELLTDATAVMRWFASAKLIPESQGRHWENERGRTDATRDAVATLIAFRERLRAQVLRWEEGRAPQVAFVDDLNQLLALHPMRTRVKSTEHALATELYFDADRPQEWTAPLAQAAADLFAHADRRKIRKCENCVLHFLDTSKKGSRRWCSMQLCGNRFKVAAYAARQKHSA